MSGESDLSILLENMNPYLNEGTYVFVSTSNYTSLKMENVIGSFMEKEGMTLILKKEKAVELGFQFDFIASWITLIVHSSLEAVGLTAVVSGELAKHNISCNVVAGYYHDHIFVSHKDAAKAMEVLTDISKEFKQKNDYL